MNTLKELHLGLGSLILALTCAALLAAATWLPGQFSQREVNLAPASPLLQSQFAARALNGGNQPLLRIKRAG